MHMEALDRSFSTGSHPDGVMSLSSYPPLTPEPPQYSDCLQPQYSPIHYDDNYEHHRYDSQTSLEPSSPLSSSTPTPLDTPFHSSSFSHRTPLSSMASYSSDSGCPMLSSSQSSGLSEMPSISDMSLSSDPSSSTSSLFLDQQQSSSPSNYNPFSVNNSRSAVRRGRKTACASATSSIRSPTLDDSGVPRRSSAPARGVTTSSSLCPSTNSNSQQATRKDSFVYDVQLETDNVLLFVPDLDLVKSHLMFAVREEVDVLKERIGELMERINHLEYENTVLRKYAPQEALQQIQQPHGGAPNP